MLLRWSSHGLISQSIRREGAKEVIDYGWSEVYAMIGAQKRAMSCFAWRGSTGNSRSHVPS